MKIKKILNQSRRDFTAIYVCEHCEKEVQGTGYDDANYHKNVIPKLPCPNCKKIAPSDYRPLTTKYPEGHQV